VLSAVVRHSLQRLGPDEVVVVDEEDEVAASKIETNIARLARPPRGGYMSGAHVGPHLGDAVDEALGAVSGAVIDEDNLELSGRKALLVERTDETG
jgi:outer membrane lipoprotein SlyB